MGMINSHSIDLRALISPVEVGKIIGVSVNTLRNWRNKKSRLFQHHKIGKLVMYNSDDVKEFIRSTGVDRNIL